MKKKYLKIITFSLFVLHICIQLNGCPTCIGYPEGNNPPFFEEQETEISNKSAHNKADIDQPEHLTTAAKTTDNQEENS